MKGFQWQTEVDRLDALIKEGKVLDSARSLKALIETKRIIPREIRFPLARLLWRAGLPELGVRLLFPIVRPEGKEVSRPSPDETAEYAACLVKIGAIDEALLLLRDLDPSKTPSALLYSAFAHVEKWRYSESIPLLKTYVEAAGISAYQRQVGMVNLAAALVHEKRFLPAMPVLRDLLHDSSVHKKYFVLGRVLIIAAENQLLQHRWKETGEFLDRAEKVLADSGRLQSFFVKKFRAIAEVIRLRGELKSLSLLRRARLEAVQMSHWESVRDCDQVEGIWKPDHKLLSHVYFGTPFEAFRKRLLEDAPEGFNLPPHYDWRLFQRRGKGSVFDLREASRMEGGSDLKLGKLPYRLLATLCSDFYRPFRTTTLFGLLYPEEFYNPIHSPVRVRQVLKRLREGLMEARLALQVEESGGAYRLCSKEPVTIRIPLRGTRPHDKNSPRLEKLQHRMGLEAFSIALAGKVLDVTTRTAVRLLNGAILEKRVERFGKGRRTRYRFLISELPHSIKKTG